MRFRLDADIALFAVRHKLEKELRAYLYLREVAKDRSGYINRNIAVSMLAKEYDQGASTCQRHIKALMDMGWICKAGSGNLHINGILRVKALLSLNVEGFVERKRVMYVEDKPRAIYGSTRTEYLRIWKAALCSGLTQDKLRRNEKKIIKRLSSAERKNKAVIGTALAKDPQARAYAFSLKSEDWNMGIGTVQMRKVYSEQARFEWYRWKELGGMEFRTEREAVLFGNANLPNFNRGFIKKRFKTYLICIGEKINDGRNKIELGFRNQKTDGTDLTQLVISGNRRVLEVKNIKPLRLPMPKKIFASDDVRQFGKINNDFLSDF